MASPDATSVSAATDGEPGPSSLRSDWPRTAVLALCVWLHAGDMLLTATVMPTAVAEIGGLPFIYWTVALYEAASIAAAGSASLVVARLGLRAGVSATALVYAGGCVASALAPNMATMLVGRLLQGLGGGWMLALSYVGTTALFPQRMWPRILAVISAVWGVSALAGPLVGGLFATAGAWRGAFWAFAAQALALVVVVPLVLDRGTSAAVQSSTGVPWGRLALLTAGLLPILAAGVQPRPVAAIVLVTAGLALLAAVLRLDRDAAVRMLPLRPFARRAIWGDGYRMVLLLATATISFTVYGPLLMETLYGVTPLVAGLVIAAESVAWSLAAVATARAPATREPLLIGLGALVVTAGVVGLAWWMPRGPVAALLPWAIMQGAGFGLCWAFVIRRIVESVAVEEHERATAAVPTLQMLGFAIGAAASGIVANLAGFAEGASRAAAERAAFWVFAAFLPLALGGLVAAWRLAAAPAHRYTTEQAKGGER